MEAMAHALGGGGGADSQDMAARYQRAGLLWKLPMSKPQSDKWQKRLCMAKDGYILYYNPTEEVTKNFCTKPKGVLPLGGAKVEATERGPKGGKFGIIITHPDFRAGRALVLSAETAESQAQWLQALKDCSRVTMENALLGDSMVEKLRASGTAAEKEKEEAMLKLQEAAVALAKEQEEKLTLQTNQESVLQQAAQMEERAKAMETEMAAKLAEVEARRQELEAQSQSIQLEIDSRSSALSGANDEYAKLMALLASAKEAPPPAVAPAAPSASAGTTVASAVAPAVLVGAVVAPVAAPPAHQPLSAPPSHHPVAAAAAALPPPPAHHAAAAAVPTLAPTLAYALPPPPPAYAAPMSPTSMAAAVHRAEAQGGVSGMSRAEIQAIEARARHLEEEKIRLEQEKRSLERSVRDMAATTATLQSSLNNAEEMKRALQEQMQSLSSEETDLMKERQMRIRLERKLKIAEDSLRRLDGALRRSGVKLDVDVFADVKTLMVFFEERIDESRRDAQRIDIMKSALAAKKRYLVASGGVDAPEGGGADERDAWDDDAPAAPTPATVAQRRAVDVPAPAPAAVVAPRPSAAPGPSAVAVPAAAAGDRDDDNDGWSSDGERHADARSSRAPSMDVSHADVRVDAEGVALPPGWTMQCDEEGDRWFFNTLTNETSWVRPNEDGSVPPS